jgi:membrane protein DedA with SNARE-associated domain
MEILNSIEAFILAWAHTLYDAWGWLGVAALLAFENATGLTPSELILGLAGWMLIAEHQLPVSTIFLGGLYSALGSILGASITYWAARLGGRPLVEKISRWFRLDPDHLTRVDELFQRWGLGLVLVGRVIPGMRTLINIPAGLARMPFLPFVTTTFIGSYIWCTLLIGAGTLLGHEWALISTSLKKALPYLLAGGGIALLLFWITRRQLALAYVRDEHKTE